MASRPLSPMAKKYRGEIVELFERGYMPQYTSRQQALANIDQPTLDRAYHDFKLITGFAEPTSVEVLEFRFCKLPDRAPLRATQCKWPQLDVTWHVIGGLGNLSERDVRDSYNVACSWWNEVCAIRLRYTSNSKTANILARAADLGGPGNVLADSGLPCGKNPRQQPQRYDGENWVIAENPPAGTIDLTRVQCHEIGHAIGSDHIASGNLLAPMYSTRIRKPQAGDVSEMQSRYPGQGGPTPPWDSSAPTPVPPSIGEKVVRVTGSFNVSAAGPGQLVIVTKGTVLVEQPSA